MAVLLIALLVIGKLWSEQGRSPLQAHGASRYVLITPTVMLVTDTRVAELLIPSTFSILFSRRRTFALKPGSTLTITAQGQTSAQQTGGGRNSGGLMMMYLTPSEAHGGYLSWSSKFLQDAKANGWSGDFPVNGSGTGSIEIPTGKKGDIIEIVASCHGPGGNGYLIYAYEYAE